MNSRKKVKVLIVDDSALIRQLLSDILSSDPDLEVVGTAVDPIMARDKIKALNPDVLTLDVEMPRMDGLTFLQKLMAAHPMPVVMISSLTESGCETTLNALELGAVDFVTKPKIDVNSGTVARAEEITEKVKCAASTIVRRRVSASTKEPAALRTTRPATVAFPRNDALIKSTHKVVAIGASTGGTEALRAVLTALPADSPGIVIVQHMPENFTKAFAHRLDGLCKIRVCEARDGDRILPGHVLIAPGNFHMRVIRSGAEYSVRISDDPAVNRHRPSVDVLFESVARYCGANAVGAILTGMGNDGAKGLKLMRDAGARTIAQDENSCVVFGMPKEAILLGGAEEIVGLDRVADQILKGCRT